MNPKRILRTLMVFAVLLSNISCDQISKRIVRHSIEYNEQIGFIDDYFTLTKIENTGAFLSLGNTLPQPFRIILLTILPLAVLMLVLVYVLIKRNLSNVLLVGICFVIGGGIGNIYDRIVYGSVTDFLHINFVLFQTGIFNMADVSVTTGLLIVLFESYIKMRKPLVERRDH